MKVNAKEQKKVNVWNYKYSVGQEVDVELDGADVPFRTKTRSEAELLSGHTAVIWLEGVRGCYALDRVAAV